MVLVVDWSLVRFPLQMRAVFRQVRRDHIAVSEEEQVRDVEKTLETVLS